MFCVKLMLLFFLFRFCSDIMTSPSQDNLNLINSEFEIMLSFDISLSTTNLHEMEYSLFEGPKGYYIYSIFIVDFELSVFLIRIGTRSGSTSFI